MEAISDVTIEPCTKSRFIQPYRVRYKQVSYSVVTSLEQCTTLGVVTAFVRNVGMYLWCCNSGSRQRYKHDGRIENKAANLVPSALCA